MSNSTKKPDLWLLIKSLAVAIGCFYLSFYIDHHAHPDIWWQAPTWFLVLAVCAIALLIALGAFLSLMESPPAESAPVSPPTEPTVPPASPES